MARIYKPQDPETLRMWFDAIVEEASDQLNDWEIRFISDIEIRVRNGWGLSEAQEKKLEQIYADKTK